MVRGGDSFGLATTAGVRSIHKSQQTKAANPVFSKEIRSPGLLGKRYQSSWNWLKSVMRIDEISRLRAEAVSRLKQNARCLDILPERCNDPFWSTTE